MSLKPVSLFAAWLACAVWFLQSGGCANEIEPPDSMQCAPAQCVFGVVRRESVV